MKKQVEKTDADFWDERWENAQAKVVQRGNAQVVDSILEFVDRHITKFRGGSILEIGGAPGRYLGRMAMDHDLEAAAIDYSAIGCQQLRSNFQALELPIDVIERNVLEITAREDEKFDIVFSLGLIEHFDDVEEIVARHIEYMKPGGVLILGVPNCLGIYHWFWKSLSPRLLSTHVLSTMDKCTWPKWSDSLGIKPIEIVHTGGFDPYSLNKNEVAGFHWKKLIAKASTILFNRRFNILGKTNNRFWSGYLIGAFALENA